MIYYTIIITRISECQKVSSCASARIEMAGSSKTVGYQCEFVDAVSEDFVCGLCRHVAREPQLTSCCGETFCKACITPVSEDKQPCPSCKTAEFTALLNVKYQRRILGLDVWCTMKDRGCEWTGKLEGLEAHLNLSTGDCKYVDVECSNEFCTEHCQRSDLASHLSYYCPKRAFTCQHCNFKATYEVVSNDHWPQCSFYPVPCPNACGIQAIERGDLEAHLQQCPLEEVECTFLHAGCNTKLQRQDMEKHMEENTQKHLALMSEMNLRVCREFESKLQRQEDEFQRYTEQMNRETAEKFEGMQGVLEEKKQQIDALGKKSQESLQTTSQEFERKLDDQVRQAAEVARQLQEKTQESETEIRDLRSQLQEKKQESEAKIRDLQQKAQQVGLLLDHMTTARICSPLSTNIIFEMPDFNKYVFDKYCKDKKEYWSSPPMYTHTFGYKFRIIVWLGAPVFGSKYMAVYLDALKGEFDCQLKWPAKWTMVLHVLNQKRDQNHVSVTETFSWDKPIEERFGVKCFGKYEAFVANSILKYVTSQKQYLKDNTLLFKLVLNH